MINTSIDNTKSLSISELRQNATAIINAVIATQQPTVIVNRSKPQAVLVDINYFRALEEAILDLTDTAEAEKAKKEPKKSLESYLKRRFGKSGL